MAVKDFIAKKNRGELPGKKRILIFNNKGEGPCRQGQYFNAHRLLLHRELKSYLKDITSADFDELIVQYIVGLEENNYNIGLEQWVLLEAFQSFISQGVLHALYLKGGSSCRNLAEYENFISDYLNLKKKVIEVFERVKPNRFWLKFNQSTKNYQLLNFIFLYFGTGLWHSNGLKPILEDFSKKWVKKDNKSALKIHIEGEAYMRVAQISQVFKSLVDAVGFDAFALSYSPLWSYLEYIIFEKIITASNQLKIVKATTGDQSELRKLKKTIRKNKIIIWLLRHILTKPLYDASGLSLPDPMNKIIEEGRAVLPTAKPYGELAPLVGESVHKLNKGYDLFLNVAPDGCMVSSMGELLINSIYQVTENKREKNSRVQSLFSLNGELDYERLDLALLKILQPYEYYSKKSLDIN